MKLKLDIQDLSEDFFEDARLLGIVAPVKNYQFCWQVNRMLQFNLRINNDIEIQLTKKQRKYFFDVYEYAEPTSSLVHYVYNNHFDGEYLLPEFKHLDFLWLLKGDAVQDGSLQELIKMLKTIHLVQLVTELTNEKIKHKTHLVF
ncbi:MAG TPA: IPExxxVDY family protein [Puia sp.]|nr:IPExxxVDY family protein [Puia sp.]